MYKFALEIAEKCNILLRVELTSVSGLYKNFNSMYDESIYNDFCSTLSSYTGRHLECRSEGKSLFVSGLNNVKSSFINLYINAYHELELLLKTNKGSKESRIKGMVSYPELGHYPELKAKYIDDFFDILVSTLDNDLRNGLENIPQNYKVFFPLSTIITFSIFIIYMQILITLINHKQLNFRRLLGLIPSEYIRRNGNSCSTILKKIS